MDCGLLGPLSVRDGARPVAVSAPRQRVLLATLLLSAGRMVSSEALAILEDLQHPDAGQIRAKLAGLGADPVPEPGRARALESRRGRQ